MVGRVVSTKMEKTAVVLIASRKSHPLYKKTFAWSKKYLVDDPIGVKLGDLVEIVKIRPISKKKHWQITKVVGSDFVAIAEEQLKEKAEETIEEVMPEESEDQNTGIPEVQKTGESDDQSESEEKVEKPKRSRKMSKAPAKAVKKEEKE